MSELEKDNELRNYLQNIFEEEESNPPRGLFAEILKEINVKPPWWKLPFIWITFSILFVFIPISIIVFNKKENFFSENITNIKQTKEKIKTLKSSSKENRNTKLNNTSIKNINISTKTTKEKNNVENKKEHDYVSENNTKKNSSSKINNKNIINTSSKKNNRKDEDYNNVKNNYSNTKSVINEGDKNIINNNLNEGKNKIKTNQFEVKIDNTNENKVNITEIRNENIKIDTTNKEKTKENEIIKTIQKDTVVEQVNINTLNIKDSTKNKNNNYKWSIGFSTSLGIQTRIIVPKLNSIINNDITKVKRHLLSSFSLSTDLSYKISPKWQILGGFYLTQAKGKSRIFNKYVIKKSDDYELSSPDGDIRVDNNEMNDYFSNTDSTLFKIQFSYKSKQLSIPLIAKYTFTDKKIQPYFGFGISTDIETKRLTTINITNTENSKQKEFKNKNTGLGKSFQGLFMLGIQSNFNSRINTYIDFYNGIGISPFIKQTSYKVRINYHQIRFGIKFSF